MKILLSESHTEESRLLQEALVKGGHSTVLARDGAEALEALERGPFDALLAAWDTPGIDGVDLVRRIRAGDVPAPLLIILIAGDGPQARERALDAGADEYLRGRPTSREIMTLLATSLARRRQPAPLRMLPSVGPAASRPPFVAVAMAASTGGPTTLSDLLCSIDPSLPATFLAVLHGPTWMLETFVHHQRHRMGMPIRLAEDGLSPSPGVVYLAPGDRHLSVDPRSRELRLTTDPPENYVRPSADPLFRSIARTFGRHSIAVVLTGMGRDGSVGAEHVAAAGGIVIAQDPATCVAPSMPQTVVNLGIAIETARPEKLAAAIAGHVERLSVELASSMNSEEQAGGSSHGGGVDGI